MDGRTTTEEEDLTYALLGILDVFLVVDYGEGRRARDRLLDIMQQRERLATEKAEHYRKTTTWLSPTDPWENHWTARKQHEPGTGDWLLHARAYRVWKSGTDSCRHLWLHGPAGSGKTILCSTSIEDVQAQCRGRTDVGQAIFYFSFSDQSKQSYESLVRSMIVQLGWREPGLSLLRQAYKRPEGKTLGLGELHQILTAIVESYDRIFLHLDGLDECLGVQEVGPNALSSLETVSQNMPNVCIIATSRDYPETRTCMDSIGAAALSLDMHAVNADVKKYVSTQLSTDPQLRQWPAQSKRLVRDTLAQRAQGMFRWAVCQLSELKRSKSTKPKSIEKALAALPKTLDETYVRMLANIADEDFANALVLLRWITYAESPRTLHELTEATVIDNVDEARVADAVDADNRGSVADTLRILAGLVTMQSEEENLGYQHSTALEVTNEVDADAKVRLAHFSVREFLESRRILESDVRSFHFDPAREHRFLAQSCLVYLHYYSSSPKKMQQEKDLHTFPLVEYASKTWFYHTGLQGKNDVQALSLSFLTSTRTMYDWLAIYQPDRDEVEPFTETEEDFFPNGLYYASFLGLQQLSKLLLEHAADVNAQGGKYGNALYAASAEGHLQVVQLLLEHAADVNAQGGKYGNALQAASYDLNLQVMLLLLDNKATEM